MEFWTNAWYEKEISIIYREFIYKFGKEGVANKQNPVGKNNKNRQSYLEAADSFLEKNKVTCSWCLINLYITKMISWKENKIIIPYN